MATKPVTIHSTASPDLDLTVSVVESVSTATEVPVSDLPPLYDVIDPDALDALFAERTTTGSVRFQYAGCEVTVNSDRTVEVSATDSGTIGCGR